MMSPKDEIFWLSAEVRKHDELYYNQDKPIIMDREYDKMYTRLVELERAYPQWKLIDSPTFRVGGNVLSAFTQVQHSIPMLSVDNTYTYEELLDFDVRVKKLLAEDGNNGVDLTYICDPKVDGTSLSVRYENGLLAHGVTRGDGKRGDNVTENVKTIRTLPLGLGDKYIDTVLEVRGEVYMTYAAFDKCNEGRSDEDKHATPRNLASGTLKLLESKEVAKRGLSFIPHGIGEVKDPHNVFPQCKNFGEWLDFLKTLGFPIGQYVQKCKDINEAIAWVKEFGEKIRPKLPFPTDGIVIKVDSMEARKVLGLGSKSPRWCKAFKFETEQVEVPLKRVVTQTGKSGKITPIAEFDPGVLVGGVTVRRASLHNYDDIVRKDIRLNDIVLLERGGEVIPFISGPVFAKRPNNATKIDLPTQCPSCKSKNIEHDGAFYFCRNPLCSGQLEGHLEHFVKREQMDIEDVGPSLIEEVAKRGWVKTLADLYRLTENQLLTIDRIGEKVATKVIANIKASKQQGLARLLAGLGIHKVGNTASEKFATHFHSMKAIRAASKQDLQDVIGGTVVGEVMYEWMRTAEGSALLDDFEDLGLKLVEDIKSVGMGPLKGLKIVVTGTLTNYDRVSIQDAIEKHGGEASDSVSKKTSYVLVGDKPGSKVDKAKKLGVKIITEKDFEDMIASDFEKC